MSRIKLFENRILIKKPDALIKRRCQLAQQSIKIFQQLDLESKVLKKKLQNGKIVLSGESGSLIPMVLYSKVTNLQYQNQYLE
jgi:hypothetical protein